MLEKELYETPKLSEIGDMSELTKQCGWGLQELFASIINGGPIDIGGSCRDTGTCTPSLS